MIIVGIDPGIATLGYGVIEKDGSGKCRAIDYGVVVTPKDETLPVRLAMLEEGVAKILDKFNPDEISMEELFFSKNITTGIAVAHARGVALLACVKKCGKLYEYTPMQIKQALTGYGRADKKQMQQVVTSLLGLESVPKPDDAADALAIALCHAFTSRFGSLFAVGNTTRTKGHNTVTGSAFQSMMEEEGKKRKPKTAGQSNTAKNKVNTTLPPAKSVGAALKGKSATGAAKKTTGGGTAEEIALAFLKAQEKEES